eukprot:m.271034 g.271034  ORF g.271034 m.271034 type:complete len:395 (-) comp19318_c0_seq9:115-1299(-)
MGDPSKRHSRTSRDLGGASQPPRRRTGRLRSYSDNAPVPLAPRGAPSTHLRHSIGGPPLHQSFADPFAGRADNSSSSRPGSASSSSLHRRGSDGSGGRHVRQRGTSQPISASVSDISTLGRTTLAAAPAALVAAATTSSKARSRKTHRRSSSWTLPSDFAKEQEGVAAATVADSGTLDRTHRREKPPATRRSLGGSSELLDQAAALSPLQHLSSPRVARSHVSLTSTSTESMEDVRQGIRRRLLGPPIEDPRNSTPSSPAITPVPSPRVGRSTTRRHSHNQLGAARHSPKSARKSKDFSSMPPATTSSPQRHVHAVETSSDSSDRFVCVCCDWVSLVCATFIHDTCGAHFVSSPASCVDPPPRTHVAFPKPAPCCIPRRRVCPRTSISTQTLTE